MSIFEDLIEELKEENLLEETVLQIQKEPKQMPNQQAFNAIPKQTFEQNIPSVLENEIVGNDSFSSVAENGYQDPEIAAEDLSSEESQFENSIPFESGQLDFVFSDTEEEAQDESKIYQKIEKPKSQVSSKEYFRKRAMDEVTGLQMVDHVLSGIEREQMKVVPKPYDDLPVKLALHDFLQDSHEADTTEHAQSEFKLMQETENWYTALSHRDKQITVANLRRYCETTRPALSAQALIALARFYRNSPYTEQVRSKFELVVTRLFSREDEFERRELLLNREEIIQQVKELYADWSSIQLYSANDQDSEIVVSMMKFDDFISEAEKTETFEELISNDFFNRLRIVKEDCQDNFFAPIVTAAAVIANVQIGNRYLDLLDKEKEKFNAATLEEKYGFLHDQLISDTTGKSFQLIELLKEKSAAGVPAEIVEVSVKEDYTPRFKPTEKPKNKFLAVNKWLLAAAVLILPACLGIYFWAEYQSKEIKTPPSVKKVNIENSEFKDYIKTARIDNEVLYGITTEAWDELKSEKKEEVLKKIQSAGEKQNYKQVHLIDINGKSVGFATAEKAEVYNP